MKTHLPYIFAIIILVTVCLLLKNNLNYYKVIYDKQVEKNQKDSLEYTAIIDSCSSRYFKELKK